MRFLYFPPFLLALSLLVAGVVHRRMDRATRPPFAVMELRWFLGALFVFSGLAKLIPGFPNTMGPAELERTLAPYGLAVYARFIAAGEIGVGLMLFTRRFATLGALLLAPMLSNILVITISLQWRGTPYLVSAFLVMDLALLIYDRSRLWPLILDRADASPTLRAPAVRSHIGWLLLLAALLVGLGSIRIAQENTTGMLLVAALVLGLATLDWREAH
jgi:uncharacterized membrane protein YphA (DoxX/SURF4 family)